MSAMRIRRLNEEGIRRFALFLDSQTGEMPQDYAEARAWLTSGETSEGLSGMAEADPREVFARRFDLAAYLHERIPALKLPDATRDAGLWAWLALLWFEQLCPQKNGRNAPGETARWIPEIENRRRYYRHFVLGPYVVYAAHQDDPRRALVLLSEPVQVSTSEIFREFVESPVLACRPVVQVATGLYYDLKQGRLKRGVGVKGAGGARRLVEVLMQFDRTFDLHTIDESRLAMMLPREFDRFRVEVRNGAGTTLAT